MRARFGLLWAAVTASASLGVGVVPAQATFPGKNGKIIFGSGGPQGADSFSTFTINPDGSGRAEILPEGGMASWSPDGMAVAYRDFDFHSCCHPSSNLDVSTADGSNVRRLTDLENANVTWIEWSYDGKRIAISATLYRRSNDIYVVNADGTGTTRIKTAADTGSVFGGDWSPDETKIAFEDSESQGPQGFISQVHVLNVDGSNERALTTGATPSYRPRWSPSGNEIAFLRGGRIWLMKADGSDQHPIIDIPLGNDPIWSPDGKRLAFSASNTPGGKTDIYTVNEDGTDLRNLTPEITDDSHLPVWSPDGTKIAFQNGPFRLADIWIMNVDGSQKRNITLSPERYELRDWQAIPGPRRIDYKNSNEFCKAEQAFWGYQFSQHYRNFGQCVSGN